MDRRQLLGSIGAIMGVSVAGCSGESSTSSPTSASTDETENSSRSTETTDRFTQHQSTTSDSEATVLIDDTITLSEGGNTYADFSVSSPATVEYDFTVQNGVDIDLFLLTLDNFRKYRSGQSFSTIQTADDNEAMDAVQVSRGNYYVVLDHSDRGPTSPPGQFEQVSATVEATVRYIK